VQLIGLAADRNVFHHKQRETLKMLKLPWTKTMQPERGTMFTIEPMFHSYIDAILKIESVSFGEPWPGYAFSDVINSREYHKTVAFRNGKLAGYCVVSKGLVSKQIENIAVAPEFRRTGVGRCLIFQQLSMLGCANQLLAAVSDKNLAAHQFFRSMGFCAISIGTRFFANRDDAYIFQWRVGAKDRYIELRDPAFVLPEAHKRGVPVAR
jgi:ribosomal-protein-alanine N-acetyltransferase